MILERKETKRKKKKKVASAEQDELKKGRKDELVKYERRSIKNHLNNTQ